MGWICKLFKTKCKKPTAVEEVINRQQFIGSDPDTDDEPERED